MMKYLPGILFALIIIFLNFRLVVFNNDFYSDGDFSNEINSKEYAYNLINYFKYNNELNDEFFNQKEKEHLNDVKKIINLTIIILYIFIFIFIFFINKFQKELLKIFVISLIFMLITTITAYIINFNKLFYNFHLLIFNNNLWLLDPATDNLINFFPEIFFYKAFREIILKSLAMNILIITLYVAIIKVKTNLLKSSI